MANSFQTHSLRRAFFLRGARALAAAAFVGALAHAQPLASPAAHWGSVVLPDQVNRFDIGYHAVGFTRYGKETVDTGAARHYRFNPYNEYPYTLGFNILSASFMDNAWMTSRDKEQSLQLRAYSRRATAFVGYLDDGPTRYFQNSLVHHAHWKSTKLDFVPRSLSDTPLHASLANEDSVQRLVWGVGEEYFLRLAYTSTDDRKTYENYTPYYVGAGWLVSSINHEAFLQAGSNISEFVLPQKLSWLTRTKGVTMRGVGFGGNARTGLLLGSKQFPDLTSAYANVQLVGRVRLDFGSFPVELEYAQTATFGYFVAPRDSSELDRINEVHMNPSDVPSAKHGMTEVFSAFRVRVGQFTFETYNDQPGGKDKGPSFGASIAFNFYKPGLGAHQ